MERLISIILLVLAVLVGDACTVNPATGERQFNVLSESQELQLGEEAAPQFIEEYGGEIPSPEIQEYVRQIGQQLAEQSERPDLPWDFTVVDSSTINAFALPGGKVFISRGLLAEMKNEAQLAGVLGHEIGHVTAEHIGQQMSRQIAFQAGLAGLGVAAQTTDEAWLQVLGAGAQVGGGLYLLSFGREQENEADELGLRYMANLGYNPIGQLQVMQILKRSAGGGGGGVEFLSTHPLPDTRIERIENLIQTRYPGYNNPRKYRLNRARFQETVMSTLEQLPPPRHNPDSAQQQ